MVAAVPRDFVTVDMRGMKPALEARARSERRSVSAVVRSATERLLGAAAPLPADGSTGQSVDRLTKLSIRLTVGEAARLSLRARSAGKSRDAYLAELVDFMPEPGSPEKSGDLVGALVSSCGEMSTLCRDLKHLVSLLKTGAMRAAREYEPRLETLEGDVRRHLDLTSSALRQLKPPRRPSSR